LLDYECDDKSSLARLMPRVDEQKDTNIQ